MGKEEGKKAMIFCCRIEIGSPHHPWQTIDTISHSAQNTEKKNKWPFWLFSWQRFRVMGLNPAKNCVF
jgi:hypothetical protein